MQKIVLLILTVLFIGTVKAQEETPKVTRKFDLSNRPGDHLLIQVSADNWSGMPDSISSHQKGFSRGFNAYLMLDKPFKSSPKFSLGLGIGIGTSNIIFKNMNVDIKANAPKLPFIAVDSTIHFKKYKLSTSYLEVPLELRYATDPMNPNKSWKIAIGGKVGTLINVHTKGKELLTKNNTTLNDYIQKENSKKFFNGTRFMGTARVGYGIISIFGAYQLNNVLKDAAGPAMKLYQIGLTLSGL